MKTSTYLSRLTHKYVMFTLAAVFALLSPSSLWAAHSRAISSRPAEDLKQFEGTYQLLGRQSEHIKISAAGNGLVLKEMWSNREIRFKQKEHLNFVAVERQDFTLDFARDKNGTINQVTAFKSDIWIKVDPKAAGKKPDAAETARLNQAYHNIFPAFQEAINANSDAKIQSFLTTYLDQTLIEALTLENLVLRAKGLYEKTGGIALDTASPIDPETGSATFKSTNQGSSFLMSFTLNQAGKITNFGLQE